MMVRTFSSLLVFAGFLLHGSTVRAEMPAATGAPGSFILDSIALLVVFAVILITFKIYRSIRGGRAGNSWLWLLIGFSVWSIGQSAYFFGQLGIISHWGIWVQALQVVALLLVLIGVMRFRKLFA